MSTTLKYLDDGGLAVLWAKIKDVAGEDNVIESVSVNGTTLSQNPGSTNVNLALKVNNQQLAVANNGVNLTIKLNGTSLPFDTTNDSINIPVDSSLSDLSSNPIANSTVNAALGLKAPLASPEFTGNPKATTQDTSDNSTKIATTAFVKAAIAAASIGIQFEIVTGDLPATGDAGTIYLKAHSPATRDIYDEYVWVIIDSSTTPATYGWEKIGTTQVDLSNYVQFSDLVAITSAEIDQICT